MTAKGGEALEVAMLLLRAPALRSALRARPLPDGVGEVLAIASGLPAALSRAAERSPHDEAALLEASRFFVQQVLLADGADAYRVLGTDRHANRATLRNHHHLLQRWLHPDRSDEDEQWDSALATRVNRAWQRVRTDAARNAYDATLPAEDPPQADPATASGAPAFPVGAAMAAIHPAPVPQPPRPVAAPIFVGLLAVACLVLTWFALNREPAFDEPAGVQAASTARPRRIETPAPASAPAALHQDVRAPVASTPSDPAHAAPGPQWPQGSEPVQPPEPREPQPAESFTVSAEPEAIAAVAWADEAPPAREWPVAEPLPPPPAMAVALASVPAPSRAPLTPPVPVPTPVSVDGELDAPAAQTPVPAPTLVAAAPPADPLQLFQEAEATLRGVTAYLGPPGAPEPAWLDPATGHQAAAARGRLQARHEGRADPRLELESPNWTLGSQSATVLGAYRLGDRRRTVETGVLRLELARRDDRWRVSALSLEPAR